MNLFQEQLLAWYKQNKRDLPWRQNTDPYIVWLSEIILQQTRVEQGLAYFNRFAMRWPKVTDLAAADEQEVLKMWQGLGYYSRARNLLATAREIVNKHKGVFPVDYGTLIQLKGVGPYTAAAISSIAGNQAKAVVDGNVYRVLARYFGIEHAVNTTQGQKAFRQLADSLIEASDPGTYNQAVMEFGALQCTPKKPDCHDCVLSKSCFAFANNKVDVLPHRLPKAVARHRFFNYMCILCCNGSNEKGVYLRHRKGKDIWEGLYDFPSIETETRTGFDQLVLSEAWKAIFGKQKIKLLRQSTEYKHQLTHQTLHANFYLLEPAETGFEMKKKDVFLIHKKQLHQYPFPRLIDKFLVDFELYG